MLYEPTPRHLDPHWKDSEPLLYDWFGYQMQRLGPDVEDRARFLTAEINRRARMAAEHPEWLEIWGVRVERRQHLTMAVIGPISRSFLTDVLESVARHWMPPGWDWHVLDTVRGPVFTIVRFDPCAAGERFIVDSFHMLRDFHDFVKVHFVGGRSVTATREEAMAWHSAHEAPADIVKRRLREGRY